MPARSPKRWPASPPIPTLRRRMGEAARRRVLDGFTVAHVTAGVRDAYQRMLAG